MEQRRIYNAVGPVIRRMRSERGWTQEILAAKIQVAGLPMSRGTLAKVEAQIRIVTDVELLIIASIFGQLMEEFFPPQFARTTKRQGWMG